MPSVPSCRCHCRSLRSVGTSIPPLSSIGVARATSEPAGKGIPAIEMAWLLLLKTLPAACCTGKWNAAVAAAKESHAVVSILPGVMLLPSPHSTESSRWHRRGAALDATSTRLWRDLWCLCVLMIVPSRHTLFPHLSPLSTTPYHHMVHRQDSQSCSQAARGKPHIHLPHAPLRRCRDAPPVETPSAPAECGCATNEYFVLITWTHITHDKQAARTKKRSVAAWAGWGNPRTSPASKHPPSLSKHASRRGLSRRQKSVVANTPRATCLMSPHRLSVSVARNGRVRSASAPVAVGEPRQRSAGTPTRSGSQTGERPSPLWFSPSRTLASR